MEFIKDISIIIDPSHYRGGEKLDNILAGYNCERTDSCYKVKGTFEKLDNLVETLLSPKHGPGPATHRQTHQQLQHASAHVTSVTVSAHVMEYIQQIRPEKLKNIQGQCFLIETQPRLRAAQGEVQVSVRAQRKHPNPPHRVQLDFVRQRFITFYQRTASDLQIMSFRLGPHDPTYLQRKFPLLLFKLSTNKNATVIGPFAYLDKLKEFLSHDASTSSTAGGSSSKSSGASLQHSRRCENEPCPICMEQIKAEDMERLSCKHSFCKDCVKRAFNYKPVCPVCGQLYGILRGNQPEGGTMNTKTSTSSLPGYEKYGTIIINYHLPSGIQKEDHPNPGQPFVGVSRTAYLPDSPEGRRILELLRRAFDQSLIFTIGVSNTSGRSNVVTWNDIHHKTSTHGGPTQYGYPDPDYLSRVQEELKIKGVK